MNPIVMNTLTGAVSEYAGQAGVNSISPNFAGSAEGLRVLGGDTDNGAPIVATVSIPKKLWGTSLRKRIAMVYLTWASSGPGVFTVRGESGAWAYSVWAPVKGASRVKPGQGIDENYLGFDFANSGGQAFTLDQIEVQMVKSANRRV